MYLKAPERSDSIPCQLLLDRFYPSLRPKNAFQSSIRYTVFSTSGANSISRGCGHQTNLGATRVYPTPIHREAPVFGNLQCSVNLRSMVPHLVLSSKIAFSTLVVGSASVHVAIRWLPLLPFESLDHPWHGWCRHATTSDTRPFY